MAEIPQLRSRERQIMDVVFRLGEATARDIEGELPDPLANATIRTMLRILESKGYLTHREKGRTFIYAPAESREKMAESAMRRLLGVFYNGSVTEAVSGLLRMEDTELSEAEIEELESMVEAARKKGKAT